MKKDLIKIIRDVNPGIEYLVSPFWGGGSTEMLIASEGVKVQGYDVFLPLADFWEIVVGNGGAAILADMAEEHFPLVDSDHYKSFLPGTLLWKLILAMAEGPRPRLAHGPSQYELGLLGLHIS